MTTPKLKQSDRAIWDKLFGAFKFRTSVEVEMSLRYLDWFKVYKSERKYVVDQGQIVKVNSNGVVGQDAHFKCMSQAEKQMAELWSELKDFAPADDDNDEPAEFKGL